jgi:dTDP-L-rhamnose 4-epimerase
VSNRSILVSGGAGFIGSKLVKRLVSLGHTVRVLDSLTQQVHGAEPEGLEWLNSPGINFHRGTVTSRSDWKDALEGVDQVVHLAAETGTGQSMYEAEKYCATNSLGTALLIDVLCNTRGHRVKRVLLASSRSVYGEGCYSCAHCGIDRISPDSRSAAQLQLAQWEPLCPRCSRTLIAVPTSEGDAIKPASIYAATKYSQEDLIRVGCGSLGIDFGIFRLQNVYGEGQSLKNPYTGILSIFSTRIRRGLDLPIFEDGDESRDFVHVDDVVRAFVLALDAADPLGDVFNVGTGRATSVGVLARELARALNSEERSVVTGQFRLGDIRHNYADVRRIRERLGFEAVVALREGIERFAQWVLTQPLQEDRLEHANRELRQRGLMA